MKCKDHGRYYCTELKCKRKREEANSSSSYQMTDSSFGSGVYTDSSYTSYDSGSSSYDSGSSSYDSGSSSCDSGSSSY